VKYLAVGLILLCCVAAGIVGGGFVLFALSPAESVRKEKVIVLVERGISPVTLSESLTSSGVITSAEKFHFLGRVLGKWSGIKAGEYEVSPSMTPLEIFTTISSGISIAHPLTIPEGTNMYQIADFLKSRGLATKAEFLQLCKDPVFMKTLAFSKNLPPTLEGYLFPETYHFNRTMDAKEIIQKMYSGFKSIWSEKLNERAGELGMTRHQIVTLASIIEKETGAPEERSMISSVFHNRLSKRMRLESDPTTIYGMWNRYKGNIRRKHLLEKNDYNTYKMSGLPIGPIANPGKDAIHAALYPERSNYFYFVSRNDGTHVFSETFEKHKAAVRKFQLDRRQRKGKSWRDRLKTSKNEKDRL